MTPINRPYAYSTSEENERTGMKTG